MQYYVSFNGFLRKDLRPEGWPPVIRDFFVYECEEPEQLADYLNGKADNIQRRGGMHITFGEEEYKNVKDGICLISPSEVESSKAFGKGFFVPLHMLLFINYTVRPLTANVSVVSDPEKKVLLS